MNTTITISIPYACCESAASYFMEAELSELAASILLEKSDLTKAYGRQAPNTVVEIVIDLADATIEVEGKLQNFPPM